MIDALELGASEIMDTGFDPEEAALRISSLVQKQRLMDKQQKTMRASLNAAMIDPLTGLFNRRYALPKLEGLLDIAARSPHDLAVMVADLDHFKAVNDRFGHAAGDAVLAEVSRRLKTNLRSSDLVARIGGEEFLVVLPGISPEDAETAAKRICAAVSTEGFQLPGHEVSLRATISIGLAMASDLGQYSSRSPKEEQVPQLMEIADRALYRAKSGGRNRVDLALPAA